jgi:hypothetical protein
MEKGKGRIIGVAPPIYSRFFRGKTAYAVGKIGMSTLTIGLGMDLDEEYKKCRNGKGGLPKGVSEGEGGAKRRTFDVAVTSLWPATAIEAYVTDVQKVPKGYLRKATIFADAVLGIIQEKDGSRVNGKTLVDEDYLREMRGMNDDKDFERYRLGEYQNF